MTVTRFSLIAGLGLMLAGFGGRAVRRQQDTFDHARHRKVFPECEGCHAGIRQAGRPVFPAPEVCARCHDGTVERKVDYTPPEPSIRTNLRFRHAEHDARSGRRLPGDSILACSQCHIPQGAPWLTVRRTNPRNCLDCHGVTAPHLSAPDTACATCHLPLPQAAAWSPERIARLPHPPSHDQANFPSAEGHGALARQSERNCAVCHARDFCIRCHVNAPEVKAIQALAPDPRSLAIKVALEAPQSHREAGWLDEHGGVAKREAAKSCAFCHTRQSCMVCHRTRPALALSLPDSGAGRGIGARIPRKAGGYHGPDWVDQHPGPARSAPETCETCHARTECLECHRPNPGAAGNYHPAGFLTRHPALAFNRQVDCTDCHSQSQFCVTCHQEAGLVSTAPLRQGFHDANGAFALNHGVAARQNLESCVSCHAERDCLTCHSAQGGRRFNPHGPGFDPDRLRQRNPQMCAGCHGRNIPTR